MGSHVCLQAAVKLSQHATLN